MTLAEVLPSIGNSLHHKVDTTLLPNTAKASAGDVLIGGVPATHIAAQFGTPSYVLDESDVRTRAREISAALPGTEIAYAGKALLCKGLLRWIADEGLSLDTCSAGELGCAAAVGFPGERILLHGNAKTAEDLKAAVAYRGVRVVLDSADEIAALTALAEGGRVGGSIQHDQRVLVRVAPGISAGAHPKIRTGTDDCKFGFSLRSGAAAAAVEQILRQPNLKLSGLHCHLGSQIANVAVYESAVRFMVGLLADIRERFAITVEELDIGGGFAVPYRQGESEFDLHGFADRVRIALHYECGRFRLPVPKLIVEPGRWLVARAGMTLYRVASVKGTNIAIDGGMSDNPRPALYGARYSAQLIGRESTAPLKKSTVVGRHCESGDVLGEFELPDDVHSGDLLAVACTGAYHYSMASNYNMTGKAPIISVYNGQMTPLVRRESEQDLLARDLD